MKVFEMYGAQPYVGCVEMTVGGSGTVNPGNLVQFPGAYTPTDPGILFDIYTEKIKSYPIPGPPVYVSGSAPVNPPATPITTKVVSVTTSKPASTTGQAQSVTTQATPAQGTTGKSASVTTGKQSTSSSSTTASQSTSGIVGVTTGSGEQMCYKPGTPNINGNINQNPPTCGTRDSSARCGDEQCCSQTGYCGPILQGDGKYHEYVNGIVQVVSKEVAYSIYCNNTSADYRKVPCSSMNGTISEETASAGNTLHLEKTIAILVGFIFTLALLI